MKRLLCCLLSAAMIVMLVSACGSSDSSESQSESQETAAVETSAEEAEEIEEEPEEEPEVPEEPEEEAEPEDAAEPEEAEAPESAEDETDVTVEKSDYTLPLFDDTFEFSWFWINNGGSETKEKQNLQFWLQLEDELNVSIDWVQPGSSVGSEQYNLMIASGDVTDLIWHNGVASDGFSTAYTGGYDAAIEDGIYLDLKEWIPEYAPNYYYYLMTNPDVLKAVTTDGGNWYAFHQIEDEAQGITSGTYIRADLLADTGLDMPNTTDGWMELLGALKENGVAEPLFVDNDGGADLIGNAFGTTMTWSFKVDTFTDEVVFDPVSDEFRAYVEWIAEAFANGYISDSFVSDDPMDAARSKLQQGTCATYASMWSFDSVAEKNMGVTLTPCDVVTVPGESDPKLYDAESLTGRVTNYAECAVYGGTEHPEEIIKFLDFFYSDTGSQIANYGFTEGESYEYVDGQIQLTPEMIEVNRDTGVTYIAQYAFEEGPFYEVSNRRVVVEAESSQNNIKVWSDINTDAVQYMSMPTLSFNDEESDAISAVAADIATAVESQMLKWMTGEETLTDESWDAYVAYIEDIGLAQYLSAYESAYARYAAR